MTNDQLTKLYTELERESERILARRSRLMEELEQLEVEEDHIVMAKREISRHIEENTKGVI